MRCSPSCGRKRGSADTNSRRRVPRDQADAKSAVIFICGCIALLGLANLVTSFMRTK